MVSISLYLNGDYFNISQIFNYIDSFDESEMILLSNFMNLVLDHVIGLSNRLRSLSSLELNKIDEKDPTALPSDIRDVDSIDIDIVVDRYNSRDRILLQRENSKEKIIAAKRENSSEAMQKIQLDRENSVNKLLFLDKIQLGSPLAHLPIDNPNNHELPAGYITITIASQIIEILRHGGKLSMTSVHKLLRLGYRSVKKLGNTIDVHVDKDTNLIVVGDIHGTGALILLAYNFCWFLAF